MRFSVIIPSCNNATWLPKCLESVINQTFQDFEIIFVDDMSTDNSVEVAKKYLRKQDTLIVNESKRLNGGTRNVGILKAKGDYIICIDSDDWLIDNKVFEDINNKLKVVGDIDIIFLNYIVHKEEYDLAITTQYTSLLQAFKDITAAIWTRVVKRELLQDTLFPEGTLYEDRIQHYRMLLKAKTFTNLGRATHIWNRTNLNSITQHNTYLWNTCRFNYCGELYRLYNELDNKDIKAYIKDELESYMQSIREMVDKL